MTTVTQKKTWKNPHIVTLTAKELEDYIKVAAKSGSEGICVGGDCR